MVEIDIGFCKTHWVSIMPPKIEFYQLERKYVLLKIRDVNNRERGDVKESVFIKLFRFFWINKKCY